MSNDPYSHGGTISAEAMRMVRMEPRTNNTEAIIQYLASEPGAVQLTEYQEKLLERVKEADRLIRKGDYSRRQMEMLLKEKFQYSIDTARSDLYLAEHIYGNANKRNKNYLMANHIDLLDDLIRAAKKAGKDKLLAHLISERTKAINSLPDHTTADTTPAAIIFVNHADALNLTITGEDARKAASDFLNKDIQDIDYEDGEV